MEPEVFQETADRVIESRGFRDWRKSSWENVPDWCRAHNACESAKSMSVE